MTGTLIPEKVDEPTARQVAAIWVDEEGLPPKPQGCLGTFSITQFLFLQTSSYMTNKEKCAGYSTHILSFHQHVGLLADHAGLRASSALCDDKSGSFTQSPMQI